MQNKINMDYFEQWRQFKNKLYKQKNVYNKSMIEFYNKKLIASEDFSKMVDKVIKK